MILVKVPGTGDRERARRWLSIPLETDMGGQPMATTSPDEELAGWSFKVAPMGWTGGAEATVDAIRHWSMAML